MTLSLHVGRLASYKHRFRFMLQPTRDKVIIDLVELHDRELITSGFMEPKSTKLMVDIKQVVMMFISLNDMYEEMVKSSMCCLVPLPRYKRTLL